jgi:hypothetical protein
MLSSLPNDILELIASYDVKIYHSLCLVFRKLNDDDVRVRMKEKFIHNYKLIFYFRDDFIYIRTTDDIENIIKFLYSDVYKLRIWNVSQRAGPLHIFKHNGMTILDAFSGSGSMCFHDLTTGEDLCCDFAKPFWPDVEMDDEINIKDLPYRNFRVFVLLLWDGSITDECSVPWFSIEKNGDSIDHIIYEKLNELRPHSDSYENF